MVKTMGHSKSYIARRVSTNLRRLERRFGVCSAELAEMTGIEESVIARAEIDAGDMSLLDGVLISRAFGLDEDGLYTYGGCVARKTGDQE